MTTPSNKVAIVTGGAGGIGAAVCERLARDGFTVSDSLASSLKSVQPTMQKYPASVAALPGRCLRSWPTASPGLAFDRIVAGRLPTICNGAGAAPSAA